MSTEPKPTDPWRLPKLVAFTLLYAVVCFGVMQRLGPDPNLATRFMFVGTSLFIYFQVFIKLLFKP